MKPPKGGRGVNIVDFQRVYKRALRAAGQERFLISAVAPAMHLIEIFLPLNDNGGRPFGAEKYAAIRRHLTERFGGMTAFTRSPAQGTTTDGGNTVHDDIVVFEVMTETPDVSW